MRESAAAGAQALVLIVFESQAKTIVREALDRGIYDQFVFSDGLKSLALVQAIGGAALAGMYGAGPAAPPASESAAAWAAAYVDAYGEPPAGLYVREVYDATIALALAAQVANSTDGTAIRNQLRSVGVAPGQPAIAGPAGIAQALQALADGSQVAYQGASGTLDWDANGDLRRGHLGIWRFTADEQIEDVETVPYQP